jgi:hypothetical protein
MSKDQAFRDRIERIETLVAEVERTADPALRAAAKELVQAVMDLHGVGIERMLEIVSSTGDAGAGIIHALASDDLVSSLLILYDLHPEDFATRVNRGVEKAARLLARRGAGLHLLAVRDAAVHLQIEMSGHTCGSTTTEIQSIVRGALLEAAPDATDVLIDLPEEEQTAGFVPLESLQRNSSNGTAAARVSRS